MFPQQAATMRYSRTEIKIVHFFVKGRITKAPVEGSFARRGSSQRRNRPGKTAGLPQDNRKRRNGRWKERRAISPTEGPSTERVVGPRPRRILVPLKEVLIRSDAVDRIQSACV